MLASAALEAAPNGRYRTASSFAASRAVLAMTGSLISVWARPIRTRWVVDAPTELLSDDLFNVRLAHEVRLRSVEDCDLGMFLDHQADPKAIEMAAFPARDKDRFPAH